MGRVITTVGAIKLQMEGGTYTAAGNCMDSAYVRVENTATRDRTTVWQCVSVPPFGRS